MKLVAAFLLGALFVIFGGFALFVVAAKWALREL